MRKINAAMMAICFAAGVGLSIGVLSGKETLENEIKSETASQLVQAKADIEVDDPRYVLGESDGRVAVYIYGSDKPEIVFNVYLHHLPDVDRHRLEEGIEVSDYNTLLSLIEDYTS